MNKKRNFKIWKEKIKSLIEENNKRWRKGQIK